METPSYAELRERYRPTPVRRLLVGESPPDPNGGPRRFFYEPEFREPDALYLAVAEVVFPEKSAAELRQKAAVLAELKERGIWLVDATDTPVNRRRSKKLTFEQRQALQAAYQKGVDNLPSTIRGIAPTEGVFICLAGLHEDLGGFVGARDVRVFPAPVYFPNSRKWGPKGENPRDIFQDGLRAFLCDDWGWCSPVARRR